MDFNQSIEFTPSSTPSPQMHDFMPKPPFMLPYYPPTTKDDEEAMDSHFMQKLRQDLGLFWHQRIMEINNTSASKSQHQLPLARIKKAMKSKGNVKLVSAETPILFSKACELFILELTLRAWSKTEQFKRRTLHHCDVARAVRSDEVLEFLVDIVPFHLNELTKPMETAVDEEGAKSKLEDGRN